MMQYKVVRTFTRPDFVKSKVMFQPGEVITEDDLKGKNIQGLLDSDFLEEKTPKAKKKKKEVTQEEVTQEEVTQEEVAEDVTSD